MKKSTCLVLLFACFSVFQLAWAQPQQLTLQNFASGFSEPLDIVHAGDERIFIVEKAGRVRIVNQQGVVNPVPFIDIRTRVYDQSSEQGLLGMAFDPDYDKNGYFYLSYVNNSENTVLSRFHVDQFDPDLGDPNSEEILLTENQPYWNHNGGCIRFGPDGYLYFGLGDGGSGGDPQNFSQNRGRFLGKMLRIGVSGGGPSYNIPPDNPFVGLATTLDEIWAIGLRNPWRFSFDRALGDMWIGDVGQNAWEEIDYWPAGDNSGPNFGWRCYEANAAFNTSGCAAMSSYEFPVYAYDHGQGCSVTGGNVYRGALHKNLWGHYFFTDYCDGYLWWTTPAGGGNWTTNRSTNTFSNFDYSGFGEDIYGQLYVCGLGSGNIYKFTDTTCTPNAWINAPGDTLTLCSGGTGEIEAYMHPSLTYQWQMNGTDIAGADSARYTVTMPGNYTVIAINGSCRDTSQTVYVDFATAPTVTIANDFTTVFCFTNFTDTLHGSPAGGIYSGPNLTDSIFDPAGLPSGTYTLIYTYTSPNGCTGADTVLVGVNICPGIDEQDLLDAFAFYPNPGRDRFYASFSLDLNADLGFDVLDVTGRYVFSRTLNLEAGRNRVELDLQDLPSGVYFLRVSRDGKGFTQKFIVQD